MKKIGGVWKYRQDKRELPVPQFIQDDLTQVEDNRYYSYFDPSYNDNGELVSIKWVGNDFGKYVITWTKDGRNRYPDIGYCAGQLLFEQLTLVGQIADILTKTGSSEFDGLAANSRVFSQCKNTYNFVSTSGRQGSLMPAEEAFCRLYNGIPLTSRDSEVLDPRLKNAYDLYRSGDLPKNRRDREDVISLYNYLRIYNETIVKQANWYKKLKDDWSFWGALRESLTLDFDTEGIPPGARKKIVEGWINDRLEFRTIN
jgi:hypothetical protein